MGNTFALLFMGESSNVKLELELAGGFPGGPAWQSGRMTI